MSKSDVFHLGLTKNDLQGGLRFGYRPRRSGACGKDRRADG